MVLRMCAKAKGRGEKGQDLVEFAVILPVLLLLLLGIIEFGIVVFSYNTVASAARDGARAGVVPSASADDVVSAALARAPGLGLTADDVSVDLGGDIVRVQVAYDCTLISAPVIEAVGGNPVIHLQTAATMIRE